MTNTDNPVVAKLGEVRIFKYFPTQPASKRQLMPDNAPIVFMNTDTNNKQDVINFCETYQYIPSGYPASPLVECFVSEQRLMKEIFKSFSGNRLTNEQVEIINSKIEGLKTTFVLQTKTQLQKMNESLENPDEELSSSKPGVRFIIEDRAGSPTSLMWYLFCKFLCSEIKISECRECGSFFLPTIRRPQFFCRDQCNFSYHKRMSRGKRKI